MNYSLQMNEKTYLAIFFRLRIHPKIIYVTECALGCNLIGHCLAIVVFFNDCRGGNGCRLFLLAAEDALLQVPELVILALLCQQLVMGAALHDLTVIHDQDQVAITDGGKAVCHDQHRTVSQLVIDYIKDGILCTKVQAGGRFIKDVKARILQERTGQCNALLLTTGQAITGFLQIGVVLQRQLADELVCVGLLGRLPHLIEGSLGAGDADILEDRLAEQLNVLRDIGNAAADGCIAVLVQIDTIHTDGAALRLVILEQELCDGGLAGTRGTNQRHLFSPAGW